MNKQHTVVLLLLLAITLLLSTTAIGAQVDLQSVSQTATVKFHQTSGLDTLSTSDDSHRIELRTHLGRGFVLDVRPHDLPVVSPHYEEVIHDVSQSTRRQPHLTVVRSESDEIANLQRCLYHGKVNGDTRSVVTLNTCTGELTGLIHLSTGELFSIEPTTRLDRSSGNDNRAPSSGVSPLSLANLRTLALQGDLRALSENTPEVLLIDVHAETKLEDDANKRYAKSTVHSRLNVDDNDAHVGLSSETTCASDGEKHHAPIHMLRKAGLSDAEIRSAIKPTQQSDIDILQADNDDLAYPIRHVEILMYHDNARLRRFNTTQGRTRDEMIAASREDAVALFNNIKSYYLASDFRHKVNIVLMGHVYFPAGDPYTKYLARDGGTMVISNYGLLENFNKYRYAYGHDSVDVGVLLSGNRFQANIMGVANILSICSSPRYNGNINSITYRNLVKSSVLTAHEIGHTLGAQHDDGSGYIMYPYVSSDTTFSPRSVRAIDAAFKRTRCTINNPATAIDLDVDDEEINKTTTISSLSTSDGQKSRIYRHNIHEDDAFDAVNQELVQDGLVLRADYHLPTDEVLASNIGNTEVTTATTTTTTTLPKSGTSLRTLLIACGGVALLACLLTTGAIVSTLRWLIKNKDFQQLMTGVTPTTKEAKHVQASTSPQGNQPFNFTPRLQSRPLSQQPSPFDTASSPNTPRVVPASPSYSETVRHRGAQLVEDDHEPTADGIIFEHEIDQTASFQQPQRQSSRDVPVEDLRKM